MTFLAFAAGGWWFGFAVTSAGLAVLSGLVVAVITTVNRIERQAASIVVRLDEAADATRPLLDLVETNEHLAALGGPEHLQERSRIGA
jgi:hypothetical protein